MLCSGTTRGGLLTPAKNATRVNKGNRLQVLCQASSEQPLRVFRSQQEVLAYARSSFYRHVGHNRSDDTIDLAYCGLVIALEEEAAYEMELRSTLSFMDILDQDVAACGGNLDDGDQIVEFLGREIGTRNTWDLSRLDAMAAEARSCCEAMWNLDPPVQDDMAEPSGPDGTTPGKTQAGASALPGELRRPQWPGRTPAEETDFGVRGGADVANSCNAVPARPPWNAMQTVAAVNSVLFERHGYQRMQRHGDPNDAVLSQVMERGRGTPAALAILYMEICQRMGVPMAAQLLDQGRYLVLWPEQQPLVVAGCTFAVDFYSGGDLLRVDEVCELFDLKEGPLQPAARREILAALLGCLQAAHWARSVGCAPEPGLALPLTAETAASGQVPSPCRGFDIDRAIAAAERRCFLIPASSDILLELTVLLYFAGRYDEAAEGLAMYMDMDGAHVTDPHIQTLREKLSLELRGPYSWKCLRG